MFHQTGAKGRLLSRDNCRSEMTEGRRAGRFSRHLLNGLISGSRKAFDNVIPAFNRGKVRGPSPRGTFSRAPTSEADCLKHFVPLSSLASRSLWRMQDFAVSRMNTHAPNHGLILNYAVSPSQLALPKTGSCIPKSHLLLVPFDLIYYTCTHRPFPKAQQG